MTPNSLFAAPSRMKIKSTALVFTLLVIFTLILTACGGGNSTTSSTGTKAVLKVAAQSYDFAQSGFNPFNTHTNAGIQGLVYETLYFVNVNDGSFTPMLATDYKWNSDNTQVTFTMRQNVKWNDGKPFSADDVAFTFNMMKQFPAADSLGVWSFLKDVTAPDANTVVMTLQMALPKGDVDWAGYFTPTLQQDFVAKDPAHNRLFMDAINLYSICVNQKNSLLGGQSGLPVRLALSTALDRNAIATQATAGLEPPGSMTGLVLPTAQSWLDPQYASLSTTADTARAEKYLTGAGFTKGSDGIYQKNGQRLSFTLRSVDSYSDWNAAAKLIADQAKAVGIEIKNVTVGEDNYYTLRTNGKYDYQLMFCGMVGGPTPYYLYNQYLNSAQIGQGKFNFVAWSDPTTDKFLNQYASTTDQAVQKQAIQGIEKVFVDNQPFIPLWTGADYDEYSTRHFTGWPDQSNLYFSDSPNTAPDIEQVILHLQPV